MPTSSSTSTKKRKRPARLKAQSRILWNNTTLTLARWPEMQPLHDKLLELGGDVVCFCDRESDLKEILTRGFVQAGYNARMDKGEPCRCHSNAAHAWDFNREHHSIVTGYALSDDGIWRQHSWYLDLREVVSVRKRRFQIVETTTSRTKYFGYQLTPKEAERFFELNT